MSISENLLLKVSSLSKILGWAAWTASMGIITAAHSAEWVPLYSESPQAIEAEILEVNPERTRVRYRLPGFYKESILIDGIEHTRIWVPGMSQIRDKGSPELPRLSHNLAIPTQSQIEKVALSVSRQKFKTFKDIDLIAPSRGTLMRNQAIKTIPYEFGPFYTLGGRFPEGNLETLSDPFELREVTGVTLGWKPFQITHRQGLRVTSEIEFEIKTSLKPGVRSAQWSERGFESMPFFRLYQRSFKNFGFLVRISRDIDPSHIIQTNQKLLIITHQSFKNALDDFVQWKRQKGMDVRVATQRDTGTTFTDIKNFIQNDYDTRKTSSVIIVGDAEHIAPYRGVSGNAVGNEADPMYGLVQGADGYPDMMISRISAKTPADVKTQVAKFIAYERDMPLDADWLSHAAGVASNEGTPTDYERADILRGMLMAWHYVGVDQHYDPGVTSAQLAQSINRGVGYINYLGHGSKDAWLTGDFSNTDINQLSNQGKLPFVVSVACVNADFGAGEDSFAERWLKVGSETDLRGAVAVFASSTNQSWVPPTVGQKEITHQLVTGQANTIGSLFFHGSIAVIEDNSSTAAQTFETWHIFGDASMQVRTQAPTEIDADIPGSFLIGMDQLRFNVGEAGIRLGVMQGERQLGTAVSDASGNVELMLSGPLSQMDPLLLTLTGFNKATLIQSVPVASPTSPYFTLDRFELDQADGQINPFDEFEIRPTLKNWGNVAGVIDHNQLELPDGVELLDVIDGGCLGLSLEAGVSAPCAGRYRLKISKEFKDGASLTLSLRSPSESQSNDVNFRIPIHNAQYAMELLEWTDLSGNLNGYIDAGERGQLQLRVTNTGSAISQMDQLITVSPSACIRVDESQAILLDRRLNPGESAVLAVPFDVDASCEAGAGFELLASMKSPVDCDFTFTHSQMDQKIGTLSTEVHSMSSVLQIPDSDSSGVTSTLAVSQGGVVASVEVYVDLEHSYIGDLDIKLVSPDGSKEILLHARSGGSEDNLVGWYSRDLSAAGDLGELAGVVAAGDWKLWMADHVSSDEGRLREWKIRIESYQ